jgi:integrase
MHRLTTQTTTKQPTRKTLTDRFLLALQQRKFTGREIIYDSEVRGLGVHVLQTQLSFVLVARPPGRKQPTRMALGEFAPASHDEQRAARKRYEALPVEQRASLSLDEWMLRTYGATTLAAAREKARIWRNQLRAGIDPRTVEASARAAARAAAGSTFEAVAEKFIVRRLPAQRSGHVVERILRNEVLPHWKARPIAGIDHRDVRQLVDKVVERGAPFFARNVFDAIRAVFSFAVDRGDLDSSPCANLKPASIIGSKKAIRTRVLDDGELRAVWAATDAIGYPFGPLVRMLALTGCRADEVAGARWQEINLEARLWTIPPERFKSETQHVVPLSDDMIALLNDLPRFGRGDHLFSSTFGARPVSGFSRAKERIDRHVGAIPNWCFHDIRRTVRTRLSGLVVMEHDVGGRKVQERIREEVAEMVIGHGRKGLQRVYDQHKYVDEMREALALWSAKLRAITTPPPANVVAMPQQRKGRVRRRDQQQQGMS